MTCGTPYILKVFSAVAQMRISANFIKKKRFVEI